MVLLLGVVNTVIYYIIIYNYNNHRGILSRKLLQCYYNEQNSTTGLTYGLYNSNDLRQYFLNIIVITICNWNNVIDQQ